MDSLRERIALALNPNLRALRAMYRAEVYGAADAVIAEWAKWLRDGVRQCPFADCERCDQRSALADEMEGRPPESDAILGFENEMEGTL